MIKRLSLAATVAMVVAMLGVPAVSAQTNAEVNAGIQLNFSTPGARSLGLGGAFIGLADDATAAFTNPAGLTTLSKPEVSIEVRQWNFSSTFTDHGHVYDDGIATGHGFDNIDGLQSGSAGSDTLGLSFLSFVWPGDGWAVAVYRHELANFETDYSTQGAIIRGTYVSEEEWSINRFLPAAADMDLNIVNTGASFAFRLGEKFTIGLGASYYSFDMDSMTRRYGFEGVSTDPGGLWGPPLDNPGDDQIVNVQTQVGDDSDTAFNVGFLWNASSMLSIGGVYRQGPSFEVAAVHNYTGLLECDPAGDYCDGLTSEFNVPDVYGLGFALRLTDAITLAFDWAHVEYSALTEPLRTMVTRDGDGEERIQGNLFYSGMDEATSMLTVDDGDEFHLGFEYVFINAKLPIALRLGTWFDPDHKIRFEGDPTVGSENDIAAMQVLAPLFQEGDDEIHITAGIGFIFGESFQLDAAFDLSDAIDTYSLSGVFRF